ncbi:MAG: chemotaxis protein CheW [Spirochaetia bacterium]|nr:chemotaxis protein CheW [Spirochaetia bacterium]
MSSLTEEKHDALILDRSEIVQILTFSVGDKLFGMDVEQCREIVKDKRITQVPHSDSTVLGIVNLRGEVVTVLDLTKLLDYHETEQTLNSVLIRLKGAGQQVSIQADTVFDVIDVKKSEFEPPPSNLTERESRFISSVVVTHKGLAVILNPKELVRP